MSNSSNTVINILLSAAVSLVVSIVVATYSQSISEAFQEKLNRENKEFQENILKRTEEINVLSEKYKIRESYISKLEDISADFHVSIYFFLNEMLRSNKVSKDFLKSSLSFL